MKVLLIWPSSRNEVLGWGDLGAVAEPLALEYLAAGAKLDGHEVRILDLRLHRGALAATVLEFEPDVVGVTAFSMHVRAALAICAEVKALRPQCRTVAGGHHATLLPEDFFEPQIDFVVCGEGVSPFRRLLEAMSADAPTASILGVWTGAEGTFTFGGPQKDLRINELPLPNRTIVQADRAAYFIDWMKPVALIRTSVGCPYRCTFCSLWKIMDGKYLMRDIDQVVEELRSVREDWVFLVDDEAFIHGPRMLRLAQAIKAAGIKKRFFTYARIDSVLREQEALRAWREVGLERLFIGIDAISEGQLADYNKRCKIAQIESGLEVAKELGIEVFAQFVVDTSYTHRDFHQLVRFIEHRKIRYPSFTVLTPIPGTELLATFDRVVELQPNGRPNWDLFDCQNAVTRTHLPKEEFRKTYRGLYHIFKGSYTEYREHSHVIHDESLEGKSP
jgi:radical SAM superfamily enzyme YgiQ (UPF0313 family)